MPIEAIEQDFHRKVSQKIRLSGEGIGRFRVFTPFLFDDGDHLAIVLKKEGTRWVLSDEAHTYMHLTYDIEEKDLHRANAPEDHLQRPVHVRNRRQGRGADPRGTGGTLR